MKRAKLRQDLTSRNTRKGKLLGEMNREVPWVGLLALIAPHTLRTGRGCPPVVAEVMRRVHLLQQLFGVTDMAMEDARLGVPLYRQFAGLRSFARLADRVCILRFRHPLEQRELAPKMLEAVSATLTAKGLMLKDGTADDASLIAAPSSTKNGTGTCDPEMRQTRKGYQWCFEMIFRISVDADSGRVHAMAGTSANAGCRGIDKREMNLGVPLNWHVAKRRALAVRGWAQKLERMAQIKASIRAKVERPFHVVQDPFQHRKACCRGLA